MCVLDGAGIKDEIIKIEKREKEMLKHVMTGVNSASDLIDNLYAAFSHQVGDMMEPELLGQKRIGGWHRATAERLGGARRSCRAGLRGAVGIVPMPSDWAAPIDGEDVTVVPWLWDPDGPDPDRKLTV